MPPTPKLDEVFGVKDKLDVGPRPSRDDLLRKAMAGGTRWHCEERIRTTLDAFFECWPELLPRSPMLRRNHYSAARVLVDEVGEMEAPAYVRWAYSEVQREHRDLLITTPRSLVFLLGPWRKREIGPEWFKKPCPKCCTFHAPGPKCPEEMEEEDD